MKNLLKPLSSLLSFCVGVPLLALAQNPLSIIPLKKVSVAENAIINNLPVNDNTTLKGSLNVTGSILTQPSVTYGGYNSRIGMNTVGNSFTGVELQEHQQGAVIKFFIGQPNSNGTASPIEVARINEKGYLGINISNPNFPLEVQNATVGYFINTNQVNNPLVRRTRNFDLSGGNLRDFDPSQLKAAIAAHGPIVAEAFFAYSDNRIKTNLVIPATKGELALVNKLKVTDYNYIDQIAHGAEIKRGFIAQQVAEAMPQAVSKSGGVIPSIFDMADKVSATGNILTVVMKKPHQLVTDDIVRISASNNVIKEVTVTVTDEKSFTINDWDEPTDMLFVYGKRVNDLMVVDYQQIFAAGIGAIQELSKQVNEQNIQIQALQAKNTQLQTNLEARLQVLEDKLKSSVKLASVAIRADRKLK